MEKLVCKMLISQNMISTQSDLEEAFNILNDGSDSVAAYSNGSIPVEVEADSYLLSCKANPNYEILDGNVTKKNKQLSRLSILFRPDTDNVSKLYLDLTN